ncbi:hydroxyethylthiazole kinase [Bifidobacterium sp. ESL0704]|uniref:hydroxyethylthiazole kinase n=1 Tax=Bifidobacterium sp. ESL0704 TaxID=2983219 RepID=UPI0023F9E86F|nr:hydroxyethylthiazole kinase [Bifidobacterium sp. ESL0704]WEV53378.1 hydroxyethylthiazole kinase [Bifidobacterium sp. ESL0704]
MVNDAYSSANSNLSNLNDLAANDPLRELIRKAAQTVRDTTPLAQSFTNFVTINLVANAQLAAGGTAAMSFLPDDIAGGEAASGASYINVGTLLPFYKDALAQITQKFHADRHRWVLDPVAAGMGTTRTAILKSFKAAPPTIIRGNASEIIKLREMWELPLDEDAVDGKKDASKQSSGPVGVESADDVEAAEASAKALARFIAKSDAQGQGAVAVSGETDLVTDGEHTYRLPGGSAMMTKITGAGCSLGGVTATYLAVADPLTAALSASALYNRASETGESNSHGPGSFQVAFLDGLWSTTPEQIAASPILA